MKTYTFTIDWELIVIIIGWLLSFIFNILDEEKADRFFWGIMITVTSIGFGLHFVAPLLQ